MIPSEYWRYKGEKHPVYRILINDKEMVYVALESFQNALCPDGDWANAPAHAQCLDEDIFFYIPDAMRSDTKEDIEQFVKHHAL